MELSGKRIVVTGGSSGIGREVVKLLQASDCTVVAAGKEPSELVPDGRELFFFQGDLSSQEGIDHLFAYAEDVMGGIDIFIANAGFAYYEKLGEPDWQHMSVIFNLNTLGVIYSAQKMKRLRGEQPYAFICTASGMGILPLPGYALYSATKAALRGFAGAYRYELNRKQRFQVVYPIATRTNFFKQAGDSPVPWPSQPANEVAAAIVRGIRTGQANIHPSLTFRMMNALNGIFPFILPLYAGIENKKFQHWLRQKPEKESLS